MSAPRALPRRAWDRLQERQRRAPLLTREGALLISLVALDLALVSRAGYVSWTSLSALGLCVGVLLIARSLPTGPPQSWLWATAGAALTLSLLAAHFSRWPQGWPVLVFVLAGLGGTLLVWRHRPRPGLALAALGSLVFISVCWRWDPSQIDVLYGLRSAGRALLSGTNPYLPLHPSTTVGAPALVHFTYGPVVAAVAALGLLAGDPRVMSVLALAGLAGALYRLAADRREGQWLVLTLCVAPLVVAMVVSAWPIVFAIDGIAWWLALRPLHRRSGVVLLGLAVGCALVEVGPLLLVLFMRSRKLLVDVLLAAGLGFAIIASFAAWTGFSRYWYYTIGIHFHGAVGVGSLSLAGILTLAHAPTLPGFLGVAVGALVLAWVVSRPTPGLGGALTDAAVVTMFAMFFAKFAFINYYFAAFAAIWLALATRAALVEGDLAPAMPVWPLQAPRQLPAQEPAQPVASRLA